MTQYLKLLMVTTCMSLSLYAADETFTISSESLNKIQANEFINIKKTFAESPSYFHKDFNIPKAIAFEDSRERFRLAPGDIIKISEDLTFGDWGGSALNQVAEEDFTLPSDKVKKTEEQGAAKLKSIQFSRSPTPN